MIEDRPDPELSCIVDLDELPYAGRKIDLSANAAERTALAERFGLAALDVLDATVALKPVAGGGIRFTARIDADVVQTCVVTLEPVPGEVHEDVRIFFKPSREGLDESRVEIDPDEESEPLMGHRLDIGEVVAEEFALALDPYPRAAGAETAIGPESPGETHENKPFAALAALKRKR